jgi:hypothetical protein
MMEKKFQPNNVTEFNVILTNAALWLSRCTYGLPEVHLLISTATHTFKLLLVSDDLQLF